LEDDDTYQRFIQHPPKESILIKINWRDNPWFPSVLKDEKDDLKERDFDSYLNVWEGEPRQSVDGAIYQQQLMEAKEGERILHVPHVKSEGVDTYWDLGKSDGTAIWFGQNIAYEYRFIDYLFEQHKGLNYFFSIMQSKPYMYRNIWLPHDAKQERLGQDRTIEAQVRATFPNANVEIIDGCGTPGSVANGIEAARSIFSQCYFDKEKCSDGIHALRHYHYKKDPQTGKTSKNPEHDWSSHGSDAFRYFAMVVQNLTQTKKKKRTHHNVGWMG
jgi:phage terminase large subunit